MDDFNKSVMVHVVFYKINIFLQVGVFSFRSHNKTLKVHSCIVTALDTFAAVVTFQRFRRFT
jgi:hypothetical protein